MTKNSDQIGDLPSVKRLTTARSIAEVVQHIAAFAVKVGFGGEGAVKILNSAGELVAQSDILDMPDRFNTAFAERGWFATSSMSVDAMRCALSKHDQGDTDGAEEVLLQWILDPDTLNLFAISRSKRFSAVHGRWHQLREALALTEEGRYWSAVPLILIACDGFASDVLGTSPFEKNADLTLFDSMVGHSSSLPAAIALVTKGIRKSSDEALSLPMRHGILHGRSLGYANRTVCGKAWMLMIAVVDWAGDKLKEEARRAEDSERSSIGWRGLAEKLRKNEADKSAIGSFVPLTWETLPAEHSDENDPPFAFWEFLSGWKSRNFGVMARRAVNMTHQKHGHLAGRLREDVELIKLVDFEIVSVSQTTVARAEAIVRLVGETMNGNVNGDFLILAFKHTEDGNIAMPTDIGRWQVQQGCIFDLLHGRTISAKSSDI